MKVIALEEHFTTPMAHKLANFQSKPKVGPQRLEHDQELEMLEIGESRIAAMDAAGIDIQVLSFVRSMPYLTRDITTALPLAQDANDRLHAAISKRPDRFAGFAALPIVDPRESVKELERAVTKLGMKGAFIYGRTGNGRLDDQKYWELFECAQSLDVPVYIHPNDPSPVVMKEYFEDYEELKGAAWGFSMEAGTHYLRLVFAGIYDAFPRLKIILGHLGEMLPFITDRLDEHTYIQARRRGLKKRPGDYIKENLIVTSSGNFSVPSFLCTTMTLGVDNVLFSVDWPLESNLVGRAYLDRLPISDHDKAKFAHLNAERVLKL